MRYKHYKDFFTVLTTFCGLSTLYSGQQQQYLKAYIWFNSFISSYIMRAFVKVILSKFIADIYLKSDGKTVIFLTQNFDEFEVKIKDLRKFEFDDLEQFKSMPQQIQADVKGCGRCFIINKVIQRSSIYKQFKAVYIISHESIINGYNDVIDAIIQGKDIKTKLEI
eukprot:403349082